MTLDETIKHCEEVVEKYEKQANWFWTKEGNPNYEICIEYASEHRQLAEWLRQLKIFKLRRGEWLRMSDLSEQEDDRYKCSHCGSVVHYKDKMDLYTFNSWCGRCGSDNGRKIEVKL